MTMIPTKFFPSSIDLKFGVYNPGDIRTSSIIVAIATYIVAVRSIDHKRISYLFAKIMRETLNVDFLRHLYIYFPPNFARQFFG